MQPNTDADGTPLSHLVASLALATDVAMGHPVEQGLGTCLVASRLAELAGLSAAERRRTYYLALLRHIGCTTENHRLAELVGDEITASRGMATLSGSPASTYMRTMLRLATRDRSFVAAAASAARLLVGLREFDATNRAICEVAQMLAARLGFEPALVQEINAVYERWDGKGFPNHLAGTRIPVTIRFTQVADLVSVLHDLGHDDPVGVVRERARTGFDPEIIDLLGRRRSEVLAELEVQSRWQAVCELEPAPRERLVGEELDRALGAAGDFADLKSPYLVGHSSGVARLVTAACDHLNIPVSDAKQVGRAALVHDLGRVGVSSAIWGKAGALSAGEWEQVRIHPYQTERLLSRSAHLAPLGAVASLHHERVDGSGYFRGVALDRQTPQARLLAVADAYHAMTEPRAHRPAMTARAAADQLQRDVRAGSFDRESTDAVLQAAGDRPPLRKRYAADLTAREIEVLRLVARGRTTREIATELTISPKTAENHIGAIYDKAGVRSRAAATMFAMQHGLIEGSIEG